MPYDDIIEKHANRTGVPKEWLKKIMHIESGGDASNETGSYKGLFQLSGAEFKRHGGSGNIFDPEQNTMAAANKIAQEGRDFKARYGKDPTLKDIYMIHQQGAAGYAAHMRDPGAPAWKNMASTGEGQQKGEAWAKKAIWGNLPEAAKAKYGSVENVTSEAFVGEWGHKVEGSPEMKAYGPFKVARPKGSELGPRRGTILGEQPEKVTPPVEEEEFRPPQVGFRVPDLTPDFELRRV